MSRAALERHQVWVYLAAIVAGLGFGAVAPAVAAGLGAALWPLLGALLYATFTQTPLQRMRAALADRRFLGAVVVGNFVAAPLLIWALLGLLPADPAIRLGVLLVLLVPCTDWFLTFTQLGRGDVSRALAVTPLNLLLQLALLPLYLLWLAPASAVDSALPVAEIVPAALLLIGLPLLAAVGTEHWVRRAPAAREEWPERLAWAPVPLLAMVVWVIAATQATMVFDAGATLVAAVAPVFVAWLLLALLLAVVLRRLFRLPAASGRALAFSFGTRNSFVVLPLALALPAGWEAAVLVVVLQSLVELCGMLVYLRVVPRLFR